MRDSSDELIKPDLQRRRGNPATPRVIGLVIAHTSAKTSIVHADLDVKFGSVSPALIQITNVKSPSITNITFLISLHC